ncbi:Hypp8601 [Branchiostoma lanceolatum]|uniref:Hypp8601 protein n=1 Tax=Branchiostoma lanceolatum TaxID=7740 RepID=A0A8J9Z7S1_BRALA|nr:Hypp8601 [Branchiostoma lanceolatum]
MKLSVVALVLITIAVTYAADLSALDDVLQRLRDLKDNFETRGLFSFGKEKSVKRCDTKKNKALTKAYNRACGTRFKSYTLGVKQASTFLQNCKTLSRECCSKEGCVTNEIKECCPKWVEERREERD